MSSVTVASCVKSPSATVCNSFIKRKIAAWFASFTRLASCSKPRASSCCFSAIPWRKRLSCSWIRAIPTAQSRPNKAAATSAATEPAPKPDCDVSFPCSSSSVRRSGSLSEIMEACASRADTKPCKLPKMAPACTLVCSYKAISASSRSRVCGSLDPVKRNSGLPSCKPWAISLNEFKSLPNKNTASGLTPSSVKNSLADLPMRWVNITS